MLFSRLRVLNTRVLIFKDVFFKIFLAIFIVIFLLWQVCSYQLSNICILVSQLKSLGIDNILGFDWPASPSPEAMVRALEVLYSLRVLDDDAKLTSPAGFQVAELPLVC